MKSTSSLAKPIHLIVPTITIALISFLVLSHSISSAAPEQNETQYLPIIGSQSFNRTGGTILYQRNINHDFHFFMMNENNVGHVQLSDWAGDNSNPIFSTDGSQIAFATSRWGNSEIAIMDSNGDNKTRITTSPLSQFRKPSAWMPDDSKLLIQNYSESESDPPYSWLSILDLTTGTEVNLNNPVPDSSARNGKLSPDGSKVLFSAEKYVGDYDFAYTIVVNIDGTNEINLTEQYTNNSLSPEWNSDGTKVFFSFSGGLYSISSDGADFDRITPPSMSIRDYIFSADSQKIAMLIWDSELEDWIPKIANPDGTIIADGFDIEFGENDLAYPVPIMWSPDNTKLIYRVRLYKFDESTERHNLHILHVIYNWQTGEHQTLFEFEGKWDYVGWMDWTP